MAEHEFARANWAVTPPRRHRIQAGRGQPKCRTLSNHDRRRKGLILTFSISHSLELATRSSVIRGELAERFLRVQESVRGICPGCVAVECAAGESCRSLVQNLLNARGKVEREWEENCSEKLQRVRPSSRHAVAECVESCKKFASAESRSAQELARTRWPCQLSCGWFR